MIPLLSTGLCLDPRPAGASVLEGLTLNLCKAFYASGGQRPRGRYGVILASTKGITEDFIRLDNPDLSQDPVTPLLESVLRRLEFSPARSLCISNACSSSLAATRLAEIWLRQGLDEVFVFGGDAVTPFVQDGFASLKLGIVLGEAACFLRFSKADTSPIVVRAVGMDNDATVVTKPVSAAASLKRAILQIPDVLSSPPDLIYAHATGTPANEETEGLVFNDLFPSVRRIGSKAKYGHTLGASAALDMILAAEKIKSGEARRVLLSSLGFGGAHAAALVEPL